jgi:hypothetical protein
MSQGIGRFKYVMLSAVLAGCASAAPSSPDPTFSPTPPPAATSTPIPRTSPVPSTVMPTEQPPPLTPTPLPALMPGPLGSSGWIVLAGNVPFPADFVVHWSPDARHILLEHGRGLGGVDLLSGDGDLLASYEAVDWALWLDSERFLLVRLEDREADQPRNAGRVASLGSLQPHDIQLPTGYGMTNGHGAVAFIELDWHYGGGCEPWGCVLPSFAVWTEDGTTGPRRGQPLAWTPDGDRLLVINVPRPEGLGVGAPASGPAEGWLEVLAWPGLDSIERFRNVTVADHTWALDPGGRYLAHLVLGDDEARWLEIVGLERGATTIVEEERWSFAWIADGRLVFAPRRMDPLVTYQPSGSADTITPARGLARAYGLDGAVVDEWPSVGSEISAARDGSVITFSDEAFSDARSFVSVLEAGGLRELEPLPLDGYLLNCATPAIAPDGSALVVTCSYNDRLGTFEGDNYVALLYRLDN